MTHVQTGPSICRHCGEPFSAHTWEAPLGAAQCPPNFCEGAQKVSHFEPLESIPSVTAGTSGRLIEKAGLKPVTLYDASEIDNPICKNCGQRKSIHTEHDHCDLHGNLYCFKVGQSKFEPLTSLPKTQEGICRNCGKKEDEHHRSGPTVLHCTPYEDKSNCRTFEPLRSEDDGFPPNDSPDRGDVYMPVMTEKPPAQLGTAIHQEIEKTIQAPPGSKIVDIPGLIKIHGKMESQIKALTNELEAYRNDEFTLKNKNNSLRIEIQNLKNSRAIIIDHRIKAEKENEQLKTDVADLENEIKNLRDQIHNKGQECSILGAKLTRDELSHIAELRDSEKNWQKSIDNITYLAINSGEKIYRDGRRSMYVWIATAFLIGIIAGFVALDIRVMYF